MRFILSISITFILSSLGLFGQNSKPTVEAYLKDVISAYPNVRDLAISPDQSEIYFTTETDKAQSSSIMFIRKKSGEWSKPTLASFSGKFKDLEPFISTDGLRLYYSSSRPLEHDSDKSKDFDIWYVTRKMIGDPWSAPINLEAPVNSEKDEYFPSLSKKGNIYFTRLSNIGGNKEDIFVSNLEEGNYITPVSISDSINMNTNEFNAFIAPDESYILFSSYGRAKELGGGDLYISYKDKKGHWSNAKNLGSNINSSKLDFSPFVNSLDNKLYFTSDRGGSKRLYSIPFDAEDYRK